VVKKLNNMNISKDTVVAVNYHLTSSVDGGAENLVEQTSEEHPFVFLYGSGSLIPDFEKELLGKKAGDTFDFRIEAAKAYGVKEQDYLIKVNKESFYVDGKFDDTRVQVGNELEMNDAEGNVLIGVVTTIGIEDVTMDFNHPLAGHDLHFVGSVLEVRAASAEEIQHGHVHGPGGHHHH
jgi:FKBP-type peptidyl-prolyl cis-trans isomerase SlyD